MVLFALGVFINHQSDAILLRLRQPGETGYSIPYGGLYRWVSAPNYLGEIIQWTGFVIAAATPAAWVFALFTVANWRRARSHHQWYLIALATTRIGSVWCPGCGDGCCGAAPGEDAVRDARPETYWRGRSRAPLDRLRRALRWARHRRLDAPGRLIDDQAA